MDRFSFVLVLLSIIVGLGMTELLNNFARQIKNRARSKFYWLHTLLAVLVFMALLQQWWESWDLRLTENWTFLSMLLMIGGPVGLYIISHILFPQDSGEIDYEKHYYDNHTVTYSLAIITVVLASLYRPLSFGDSLLDIDNLTSAFILVVFLVLALSSQKRLHEVLGPLVFLAMITDILVFHMRI